MSVLFFLPSSVQQAFRHKKVPCGLFHGLTFHVRLIGEVYHSPVVHMAGRHRRKRLENEGLRPGLFRIIIIKVGKCLREEKMSKERDPCTESIS